MPIQLISTDFDGTIFAEFEQPPVPRELQALIGRLQGEGVRWVVNTGRDMSALMECFGRAHLAVRPDYLVLVERELYRHEGARYVGVEDWNRRCHEHHQALFERVRPDLPELLEWINTRFDATLYEDPYSPFCMIAGTSEEADVIVDYLERYCASVPGLTVVRNDVYARFSHVDFSKGTALGEIQRQLGVSPANTFAAGDHYNDWPMLSRERAHHLVAPANAIPAIKQRVRDQSGYLSQGLCGLGVLEGLQRILAAG